MAAECELALQPNIHGSPPVEQEVAWLDRCQHSPAKIVFSVTGDRAACMASSNTITLHRVNQSDATKGLSLLPAKHVIKVNTVTTLALGYSHHWQKQHRQLIPVVVSGHANGDIYIFHGK